MNTMTTSTGSTWTSTRKKSIGIFSLTHGLPKRSWSSMPYSPSIAWCWSWLPGTWSLSLSRSVNFLVFTESGSSYIRWEKETKDGFWGSLHLDQYTGNGPSCLFSGDSAVWAYGKTSLKENDYRYVKPSSCPNFTWRPRGRLLSRIKQIYRYKQSRSLS